MIKVIFVDRPGSNSDELIIAAVEAEDDSTESRNRDQDDYVYYDENTNQLLDSYGFPLSQVKIMLQRTLVLLLLCRTRLIYL